jgi:hypothetical protein
MIHHLSFWPGCACSVTLLCPDFQHLSYLQPRRQPPLSLAWLLPLASALLH